MKLEYLIRQLQDNQLEQLLQKEASNISSEQLLVYMVHRLDVDSELQFPYRKNRRQLYFGYDGIVYIQLFPLDHMIELVDSILNTKGKSANEIALALLNYRLYDA